MKLGAFQNRQPGLFIGAPFPTCIEPLKFEKVIDRRRAAVEQIPLGHEESRRGIGSKRE
jgi:hypothetical protein